MESLPTAAEGQGKQISGVVETAPEISVPASTTASTTSSTTDDDAAKLFGSGKQKFSGTYVEINCQRGHHYAKYTIISSTGRTRKLPDNQKGHIGTLQAAILAGHERRVASFISRHYPNCGYKDTFDKDLEAFGIGSLAPSLIPVGWIPGEDPNDEARAGVLRGSDHEAAEWEEVQGLEDPDWSG